MYQVDVQIIYEDYLLKRRETIGVKIAYAIAYLKQNNKVNKEQALEVIFNILAGNL